MLDTDFANLAGLIEADGSIGISKNNSNTHIVRLRFFNTDLKLINWVVDVFGGRIALANSNTSYGRKPCLRVEWTGQKALPIIEGMKPYLHGRKFKVAEHAIEHLTSADFDRKEVLSEAIHILNLKGGK